MEVDVDGFYDFYLNGDNKLKLRSETLSQEAPTCMNLDHELFLFHANVFSYVSYTCSYFQRKIF